MAKKTIEVEVDEHAAFNGAELKAQGVLSYDQPLLATATARSAITYIDGDAGILRYRGYPIEQLAERKHFLEVAFLLHEGELPTDEQRQAVLDRDYNRMIALGGNIYFLAKIGATDGFSFQNLASKMTGVSEDEYRGMMIAGGRPAQGNRSRSDPSR